MKLWIRQLGNPTFCSKSKLLTRFPFWGHGWRNCILDPVRLFWYSPISDTCYVILSLLCKLSLCLSPCWCHISNWLPSATLPTLLRTSSLVIVMRPLAIRFPELYLYIIKCDAIGGSHQVNEGLCESNAFRWDAWWGSHGGSHCECVILWSGDFIVVCWRERSLVLCSTFS